MFKLKILLYNIFIDGEKEKKSILPYIRKAQRKKKGEGFNMNKDLTIKKRKATRIDCFSDLFPVEENYKIAR